MEELSQAGTRERILKAAEVLFGEHGFAGTRLHEIAERVGIQKASLFHYFASKQELYGAVLEESYVETERLIRGSLEIGGPPFDGLRALAEAWVDIISTHPARTKIFLRQTLGDEPVGSLAETVQHLVRIVVDYIEAYQAKGMFAPVDAEGLVLEFIGNVAFFFTSAPVVAFTSAPVVAASFSDPTSPECVERIKRHMVDTLHRCLVGEPSTATLAAQTAR
jgi:TetR/AcrR family transcriptional regulator